MLGGPWEYELSDRLIQLDWRREDDRHYLTGSKLGSPLNWIFSTISWFLNWKSQSSYNEVQILLLLVITSNLDSGQRVEIHILGFFAFTGTVLNIRIHRQQNHRYSDNNLKNTTTKYFTNILMFPWNDWQLVKALYTYSMDLQSPEKPWGFHYTRPLESLL